MTSFESQKIAFDVFTRQAVLIEQVKQDEVQKFDSLLSQIDGVLRKQLASIQYKTLDELSKSEVKKFLMLLRKTQSRFYSAYQQKLIDRLQKFMAGTVKQSVIASASLYAHMGSPFEQFEAKDELASLKILERAYKENENSNLLGFIVLAGTSASFKMLWSKIRNSPLPSGGALIESYTQTSLTSAMVQVENAISKGYVNRSTVQEVISAVVGNDPKQGLGANDNGETSVLKKVRNTQRAVLATVLQHVAQQAVNAAASTVWASYRWVSVMDAYTSGICRERNGHVYVYGKGPLPPAHPNCRSHVVPDVGEYTEPSFISWLKDQPQAFLTAVFGDKIAAKVINGDVTAKDFDALAKLKPLSADALFEQTHLLF